MQSLGFLSFLQWLKYTEHIYIMCGVISKNSRTVVRTISPTGGFDLYIFCTGECSHLQVGVLYVQLLKTNCTVMKEHLTQCVF